MGLTKDLKEKILENIMETWSEYHEETILHRYQNLVAEMMFRKASSWGQTEVDKDLNEASEVILKAFRKIITGSTTIH